MENGSFGVLWRAPGLESGCLGCCGEFLGLRAVVLGVMWRAVVWGCCGEFLDWREMVWGAVESCGLGALWRAVVWGWCGEFLNWRAVVWGCCEELIDGRAVVWGTVGKLLDWTQSFTLSWSWKYLGKIGWNQITNAGFTVQVMGYSGALGRGMTCNWIYRVLSTWLALLSPLPRVNRGSSQGLTSSTTLALPWRWKRTVDGNAQGTPELITRTFIRQWNAITINCFWATDI